MREGIRSAWSKQLEAGAVVEELRRGFGAEVQPVAIVFFASHRHDGSALGAALRARYPGAEVVGCTTAGEFTQESNLSGGVTALAFESTTVRRCSAVLATFGGAGGVTGGVKRAMAALSDRLGVDLRTADPKRYVGVVLVEGLSGSEEQANEALGDAAPLLSFVGGSAGDDAEFKETRVFHNGEASSHGAALLLLEAAVPFTVVKTCSFEPTGKEFRVTRADVPQRVIYELDGKPVAEVYAAATGKSVSELNGGLFMTHPLGLMINGQPWIRSPQQLLPDGGLKFYCRIEEGRTLHLMRSTGLVKDTARAWEQARGELGGAVRGGLTFNCILRRLELDARGEHAAFLETMAGMQTAGFHTYGESYLGHINQTLTALVFA